MKRIFGVLMMMSSIGLVQLTAQSESHGSDYIYPRTNVLKINPLGFARAEFQMQYEHYIKNRASSISIIPSVILEETGRESKEGWQAMVQYRSYLSHRHESAGRTFLGMYNYGFYAGAYALYMDYTEDYVRGYDVEVGVDTMGIPILEYRTGEFRKAVSALEGGAFIGVQVDVTERIVVDLNIGGGVRRVNLEDSYDEVVMSEYNYFETYDVFDIEYQGVKPRVTLMIGFTF